MKASVIIMRKYTQEWWASLPPEKTGKETEKLVQSLLTEWNKRQDFAWHRLPDAKAARGFLAAQPSDFVLWNKGQGVYLEAKATKHPYRLTADKVRQLPLLHKLAGAGAGAVVLVNHYIAGVWRAVKAENLPIGATSWDLSGFEGYSSAGDALTSVGLGA